MRNSRELVLSEYLHVTTRGQGRRMLFEDDWDKRRFLSTLEAMLDKSGVSILCWCLMNNHVHFLVHDPSHQISGLMLCLCTSYAQYFNGRHGHVGKVFQKRFSSQPITSEEHLIATIRYIHANAEDAGFKRPEDFPWSSFREIAGKGDSIEGTGICDRNKTLALVGGLECFIALQDSDEQIDFCRIDGYRARLDDAEADALARKRYGDAFADTIAAMPKKDRNTALRTLKRQGISIRQLERLTGIGRGIIAKA